MIRLLQNDVFNNRYDWHKELHKFIQNYQEPRIIMLELEDEHLYDVYSEHHKYEPRDEDLYE
jgi:hypothetical protein